MTTTIEKIESFATFPPNWSFGEGETFEPQILNKALQLVKTACVLGFQETDAFPGLNGEVMVTVYRDIDYWEFTLNPNGSLTFVYEREDKIISYQEGLPFEFAISVLTNVAFQNNLFFQLDLNKTVEFA